MLEVGYDLPSTLEVTMSIYDDYKQSILSRREAETKKLAFVENAISSLVEALVGTLGAPPEAIELLNVHGETAHPIDFKPDEQGYSHFVLELSVRDGEDVLARERFNIRGVPAIGSGWAVWVNNKQVDGRTDSFSSQLVVDHIANEIQKMM
ncbi:hypothetical protein WJ41_03095 [Burkholderia ubonensis]|nr:hypothetical protein WJ41_03095 [Burkholderia ubonensis]KVU09897.1 hypothetical protein WK61_24270 [Burkholderia ubonensis]KVU10015.1 hypothetical protein WK61_24895 [Burkholderia ubonensis]